MAVGVFKRIHDWWQSGYQEDTLEEMAKSQSKPKGSLKERFKDWWQSGYNYPDEDFDNGYDSLEQEDSTLEPLEQEEPKINGNLSSLERDEETLERISVSLELSLEQHLSNEKDRILMSKNPSREDLEALKKALGFEKGSIQHKKKGDGVYLVVYNPEKKGYDWKHLGSWSDLKTSIPQDA